MVDKVFEEVKLFLVYYCVVYIVVDVVEDEGKELDFVINVIGIENVVKVVVKYDVIFVYILMDYVFDGEKLVG